MFKFASARDGTGTARDLEKGRETDHKRKQLMLLLDREPMDDLPKALDQLLVPSEALVSGNGSKLFDVKRFGWTANEQLELLRVEEGKGVAFADGKVASLEGLEVPGDRGAEDELHKERLKEGGKMYQKMISKSRRSSD
jgi:hypothetical protein